jgi:hypothetical protein
MSKKTDKVLRFLAAGVVVRGFAVRACGQGVPGCDVCSAPRAVVDCRTRSGRWGNLCVDCYEIHGEGLGVGRGQVLLPAIRLATRADWPRDEVADAYQRAVRSWNGVDSEGLALVPDLRQVEESLD